MHQQIAVPHEVSAQLLNHGGTYEFVGMRRGGTSGSHICFCRNGNRLYALKYGPMTRVGVEKQKSNRALLEPYLGRRLPKILGTCRYPGGEAMLMEAPSGLNLPEALLAGTISPEQGLRIAESIFREFRAMWAVSKDSLPFTRDHRGKVREVTEIASENFTALGIRDYDTVSVNGEEIGQVGGLISRLGSYEPPPFSVTCYLDLLPENFVLSEDGSEWYVVDWEWTGRHDWRVSTTRFFAWWQSNASTVNGEPFVERSGPNRVNLVYDAQMPSTAVRMEELVRHQIQEVGLELDDPQWQGQINKLIAYIRFGDLRFLTVRGRENLRIPLLGEGLRLLAMPEESQC